MRFSILSFLTWFLSPPPQKKKLSQTVHLMKSKIKYLHILCLCKVSLVQSSSHDLLQSSVCSIANGFTITQDFCKFHCHGFNFRLRHLISLGGPSGTCDYCLFCMPTYYLALAGVPEYRITVVSCSLELFLLADILSWTPCFYQCLPGKVLSSTAALSTAFIVLFFFVPILHIFSFMTPDHVSCNLDVILENDVLRQLSMDSL